MSQDSNARRGRSAAKRRKIDTTETTVVDSDRVSRSSSQRASTEQTSRQDRPPPSVTPASQTKAVVRPPEAPFAPGALELWVVRDAQGEKQLTNKLTPGCRHWRIGDPNVPFCFECKKEGDVLGCHTCKRSYHLACIDQSASVETGSKDVFHCPVCIDRGWNVHPPPEILPLTPASSREASPARTTPHHAPPADSRVEQPHAAKSSVGPGNEPKEPIDSARICNDARGQSTFTAVNDAAASPAGTQRAAGGTPTRRAQTIEPPASAFMRTYDLQPPPATSSARQASQLDRARLGRPKSRYQTMPDEVDQALTVIYRELEGVTALRQDVAALQDQIKTTEQARKILENQLALELSGHASIAKKDAEIGSLKQQLAELRKDHDSLLQENTLLKERVQTNENANQAGLEEMQVLKASLRRLLGE